jgi:hypothetical protein
MKRSLSIAIITLSLLSACSSSKITSTFKSNEAGTARFSKILVLGLMNDKDRSLQTSMENHMAGDLRALGYDVITSFETYGPKAFSGLSEEQALAKLKSKDVEAVVTIVLLDKKKEKLFVPVSPRQKMMTGYNRSFWGYYSTTSNKVMEPGYYVDNIEYYWESNLYELKDQSLLYSVRTTSFNPSTVESLAHQYGKMIVKSMRNKRVVTQDPQPVKKGF